VELKIKKPLTAANPARISANAVTIFAGLISWRNANNFFRVDLVFVNGSLEK